MQLHKKGRRPLFSRLLPVFPFNFFLEFNKKVLKIYLDIQMFFFLYRSSCLFVEAKSSLWLGNDKSCTLCFISLSNSSANSFFFLIFLHIKKHFFLHFCLLFVHSGSIFLSALSKPLFTVHVSLWFSWPPVQCSPSEGNAATRFTSLTLFSLLVRIGRGVVPCALHR